MVVIVSIVILRIPTTTKFHIVFKDDGTIRVVLRTFHETNYLLKVGGGNLLKVRIRIFHYFRIVKFNAWIKHEFIMCSIIRFHIIDFTFMTQSMMKLACMQLSWFQFPKVRN